MHPLQTRSPPDYFYVALFFISLLVKVTVKVTLHYIRSPDSHSLSQARVLFSSLCLEQWIYTAMLLHVFLYCFLLISVSISNSQFQQSDLLKQVCKSTLSTASSASIMSYLYWYKAHWEAAHPIHQFELSGKAYFLCVMLQVGSGFCGSSSKRKLGIKLLEGEEMMIICLLTHSMFE